MNEESVFESLGLLGVYQQMIAGKSLSNDFPELIKDALMKKFISEKVEDNNAEKIGEASAEIVDESITEKVQSRKRCRIAEEVDQEVDDHHENISSAKVDDARSSIVRNFIVEVLENTAKGKAVIENYKLFGLDNPSRVLLAECVVENEYGANINTVISNHRFTELASLISEAFPGELPGTYYISSSVRGKGKSACGKLYDQYANLNKLLRKVQLRVIRPGQRDTVFELSGIIGDFPNIPTPPNSSELPVVEKDLKFLETYCEPWSEVKDKWEKTFSYRINYLRNNTPNRDEHEAKCASYISSYLALSLPTGHLLLEFDFQILYPHAANRMQTVWPDFAKKLRSELAKQKIKFGESDIELLFAFPKLFPVIPVSVEKHKRTSRANRIQGEKRKLWRPSRAEIQEGFIVHIKVIGDLDKTVEDMRKAASQRGTSVQPFPLVVGPSLTSKLTSYLIIDGSPILLETPLRALEVTFKAYHSLYCKYPIQSERLWAVLAKTLFNVDEIWDTEVFTNPEVLRLVEALKV